MKKKNYWKRLFFSLLIIIVLFIIVVFAVAAFPSKDKNINLTSLKQSGKTFAIHTDKANVNNLIQYYLKEENKKKTIDYNVLLTNQVILEGSLPLFSEKIHLTMTFTPEALSNGDLLLKQKSVSIGSFELPVSAVLKMISRSYNLPNFIEIQPNQQQIYVHLTQYKLNNNMHIKMKQFDLVNDRIDADLLLPNSAS